MPLLEHGDVLVIESDVVAKYVAKNIRGDDGRGDGLYPKTPGDEELVDSFLSEWSAVTDRYYSVLTATSQKEAEVRLESFVRSLDVIEGLLLQRSGGGDYLLGADFSYAECIAAPWVQRFYVTLPYFRGVDFGSDVLGEERGRLSRWMQAVRSRPSCLESICPEEEMIAACKRYYVSFASPGASGSL